MIINFLGNNLVFNSSTPRKFGNSKRARHSKPPRLWEQIWHRGFCCLIYLRSRYLKSQFSDAVTSEECFASSDTVSLSGFQQEISQSRSEPTSSGASTKAGFHKKIYCRLILGHDFINWLDFEAFCLQRPQNLVVTFSVVIMEVIFTQPLDQEGGKPF